LPAVPMASGSFLDLSFQVGNAGPLTDKILGTHPVSIGAHDLSSLLSFDENFDRRSDVFVCEGQRDSSVWIAADGIFSSASVPSFLHRSANPGGRGLAEARSF